MTAVCAPPIKLGLVIDTVAPGTTAPLLSVTVPVSADVVWVCADSTLGVQVLSTSQKAVNHHHFLSSTGLLLSPGRQSRRSM